VPDRLPSRAVIDRQLEEAWDRLGVAGAAVGVVEHGEPIHVRGFGVRYLGRPEPVTPTTLFAIASITKTYTATTAASLVEEGVLGWDEPVARWLPELRLPGDTRGDLTIRDLLCHRTGIGRNVLLEMDTTFSSDDLLARFHLAPVIDPLRRRATYSNIGYLAAGTILARAAGRSWAELVQERLLDPLDLHRTSVEFAATSRDADLAGAHELASDGPYEIDRTDRSRHAPASVIYASITDLTSWLGWHAGRRRGGPVSVSGRRELIRPQVGGNSTGGWPWQVGKHAVGLGWHLSAVGPSTVAWHDGGVQGYASIALFDLNHGNGVCALANSSDHAFVSTVAARFTDWITGQDGHDRAARAAAERPTIVEHRCGGEDQAERRSWLGTYEQGRLGRAELRQLGQCLVLSFECAPRWRYHLPPTGSPSPGWLFEDRQTGRVDPEEGRIVLVEGDGRPRLWSEEIGLWRGVTARS
jgi:CubicO group peptidase (beta-lactamase class C family)